MVDLAAGGWTIYNINVMCKKPLALETTVYCYDRWPNWLIWRG